jgi:hypothetical protein
LDRASARFGPAISYTCIYNKNLFPACSATTGPFTGTGIGLGPLSATWQSHAVTTTTITTEIHETLNVHGNFTSTVTLYHILFFDNFTESVNIVTVKVITVHRVR